jgi:hypothetical protein
VLAPEAHPGEPAARLGVVLHGVGRRRGVEIWGGAEQAGREEASAAAQLGRGGGGVFYTPPTTSGRLTENGEKLECEPRIGSPPSKRQRLIRWP